ncbi:hypothetical protein LAUMK142_05349 [Mycobacterium pseudokansasii]|uniref:Uncharacterized protein n=1 Tax=Mycobacterium pseudokansasii TaxID=2341080 RepID=A0A498QYG1_9MYCO|nr:hypothetical protein LAUMK142_05349 [Mycobacterium pseudokansasii]
MTPTAVVMMVVVMSPLWVQLAIELTRSISRKVNR